MDSARDLKVFISTGESICHECGQKLGRSAWISLAKGERGALCMSCADLDHLAFLAPGDAALTRRARKHSTLSAVVLKWSRTRHRYERQGVLVEELGLSRAEVECLADGDARERRRAREAERRTAFDREYVEKFALRVRELFPSCPVGGEHTIAEHACLKYSGRVGRSAAAKDLDERAVRLAVVARIRHIETPYDQLLAAGQDRDEARRAIESQVHCVLSRWAQFVPRAT
ncbi:MAG: DUF2293 domain-containing protein [Burkholderiaceae bacterium]|nr:DUF2293 domain-containing protein [Burkholderiaceae bacterium]MDH3460218.1 DUF2293 domain-containing protein [Burkholderiaceae bacterium]